MRFKRHIPTILTVTAVAATALVGGANGRTPHRRDISPIVPTIPEADRTDGSRVFLEHADSLMSTRGSDFRILVGNVEFRRGPMFMYCDSAHFYDATSSFNAYGNVRMEQGDTLFVYADSLNYIAPDSLAILFAFEGKKVRLINRDVELRTDIFNYDLREDIGYYEFGGELTDAKNRLVSQEGEYSPSTKEAVFTQSVHLTSLSDNDTLEIFTDNLYYNTATHLAMMSTYSVIYNSDGTIVTTNGEYNTDSSQASLFDRSIVTASNGNTLTGDTIYYNRNLGRGEVFGAMELNDTTNKVIMQGNYGFYNELTDSAFVTGRARAIEYSQADSLFVHADTIRAFRRIVDSDTLRYVVAAPRVKFYRTDLQGLCDSLTFETSDSTIRLDYLPVVWNDRRQITGNRILIHLNDSTADRAWIPAAALMIEEIEPGYYNQLSGKEMIAQFADRKLRHLDVNGNVVAISYPEEEDSTYNKIVNLESSFLSADFINNDIERMKLWPQTNASVTPLYLAKRSLLYLPSFVWYADERPGSPDEIFNFSPALISLFNSARGSAEPAPKPTVATQQPPQATLPEDSEPSESLQPLPEPENQP